MPTIVKKLVLECSDCGDTHVVSDLPQAIAFTKVDEFAQRHAGCDDQGRLDLSAEDGGEE